MHVTRRAASFYTEEQLAKAKELADTLQAFSNRDIQCIIDRKVTDKTRMTDIADILVSEFGEKILSTGIIKLFGEDRFTK